MNSFFSKFSIGRISDGRIVYDLEKNILLSSRYLKNYYQQCQDCFARPVCRGSVQRYLFISNDGLDEWDNMRCQYFMAVLERWMEMLVGEIVEYMKKLNALEGTIQLVAPLGKVHYPMFVMKEGLSLSYSPFSK